MGISVNDGGTIKTLGIITVNDSGVLRNLGSVVENNAGVLHTIFSSGSFPSSLSWTYTSVSGSPTVTNNGFAVSNNNAAGQYMNIQSGIFNVKGNWNVKLGFYFTLPGNYSGGGGSLHIYENAAGKDLGGCSTSSPGAWTYNTLKIGTGSYYFKGSGSGGGPNGGGATYYALSIAVEKA